eukprot:3650902-Alexandrium_andersonii.AAC.1
MSASLVGSEMCIRDRCLAWAGGQHGCCLPWQVSGPHLVRRGVSGWGPRPVSYTHLTLPTICSV